MTCLDEPHTYVVRMVGQIAGPTKRNGQKTFCVVAGLFDTNGAQVVHTKADGTRIPVVFTSYPIDADEQPILLM